MGNTDYNPNIAGLRRMSTSKIAGSVNSTASNEEEVWRELAEKPKCPICGGIMGSCRC